MNARNRTIELLQGNYESLDFLIEEDQDFCFSTAKKGETRKVFFHTGNENDEEDFLFLTTKEYETFLTILEQLSCQDMVTVSIEQKPLH